MKIASTFTPQISDNLIQIWLGIATALCQSLLTDNHCSQCSNFQTWKNSQPRPIDGLPRLWQERNEWYSKARSSQATDVRFHLYLNEIELFKRMKTENMIWDDILFCHLCYKKLLRVLYLVTDGHNRRVSLRLNSSFSDIKLMTVNDGRWLLRLLKCWQ